MPYPYSGKSVQLFNHSKKLVSACYALAKAAQEEEKTNLSQYLCDAATTVHMNLAQAVTLSAGKRKEKLVQKALNALVIVDAAVDVLIEVNLATADTAKQVLDLSTALHHWLEDLKKEN